MASITTRELELVKVFRTGHHYRRRATAMPASAKNMKNPILLTPAVQREALAHFADHCAVCHGNNGDGQTMLSEGMYPKPPDLRNETQTMGSMKMSGMSGDMSGMKMDHPTATTPH